MTGQEEEPRIILDKPVPINADFVDFEIEREDWNKYKLADNTLLKARFVLLGVLMDKSLDELRETLKKPAPDQTPKIGFGFRSQYVFSIEPPKKLRGTPDTGKYSVAELRNSIVEEDIDFETLRSTWNSYLVNNGIRLKIRLSPTLVSRTGKFDEGGMPIYVIDSNLDVKITMPEDIERIIKQRRNRAKEQS